MAKDARTGHAGGPWCTSRRGHGSQMMCEWQQKRGCLARRSISTKGRQEGTGLATSRHDRGLWRSKELGSGPALEEPEGPKAIRPAMRWTPGMSMGSGLGGHAIGPGSETHDRRRHGDSQGEVPGTSARTRTWVRAAAE